MEGKEELDGMGGPGREVGRYQMPGDIAPNTLHSTNPSSWISFHRKGFPCMFHNPGSSAQALEIRTGI